jgi:hypothetical protein
MGENYIPSVAHSRHQPLLGLFLQSTGAGSFLHPGEKKGSEHNRTR